MRFRTSVCGVDDEVDAADEGRLLEGVSVLGELGSDSEGRESSLRSRHMNCTSPVSMQPFNNHGSTQFTNKLTSIVNHGLQSVNQIFRNI
jgi:hypothetical protein